MTASVSLPPGFTLIARDVVGSTNDVARELAEIGAEDGTIVWARQQTAGKGRHGRAWSSPVGNLYVSIVLRPDCDMSTVAQLSLVSGLAVADALSDMVSNNLEIGLKWPNDVLINGAKTGGLLLEGASDSCGRCDWIVVGCGINIASFPRDTPYPATSLNEQGCPDLAVTDLLEAYVAALANWRMRWLRNGFAAVRRAWLGRAFGLGKEVTLKLPEGPLVGRFADLSATGALLLDDKQGRRRSISAGDLFFASTCS